MLFLRFNNVHISYVNIYRIKNHVVLFDLLIWWPSCFWSSCSHFQILTDTWFPFSLIHGRNSFFISLILCVMTNLISTSWHMLTYLRSMTIYVTYVENLLPLENLFIIWRRGFRVPSSNDVLFTLWPAVAKLYVSVPLIAASDNFHQSKFYPCEET